MITIMDVRIGYPVKVSQMPTTHNGFFMWQCELREVCEIHQTRNGIQVELFS